MRTVQDLWGIRGGLTLKERTGATPITDESRQRVRDAWSYGLEAWNGPQPSAYERREWKRTAGEPALEQMRGEVEAAYRDETGPSKFGDMLLLRALEMKERIAEWGGNFANQTAAVVEPFKSKKQGELADTFGDGVSQFKSIAEEFRAAVGEFGKAAGDGQKVEILVKQDGTVVATVGGGEYTGAFG